MENLNLNETMENLDEVIEVVEVNSGHGTLVKVLIGGTIVLMSVAALRYMKNRKKNESEDSEKRRFFRRKNKDEVEEEVKGKVIDVEFEDEK